MATETIRFVLDLTGSLQTQAPKVAKSLRDVGTAGKAAQTSVAGVGNASAKAAAEMGVFARASKAVQSSSLVSQLETVSAMFIQLGGNVSRVASTVTSAIRPLATAGTVLNELGGAAVFVGGAAGAAAIGLGAAAVAARGLANAGLEARDALREQGLMIKGGTQDLDSYAQSIAATNTAMEVLKVTIGERVAGEFGNLNGLLGQAISHFVRAGAVVDELRAKLDLPFGGTALATALSGLAYMSGYASGNVQLAEAPAAPKPPGAKTDWQLGASYAPTPQRVQRAPKVAFGDTYVGVAGQSAIEGIGRYAPSLGSALVARYPAGAMGETVVDRFGYTASAGSTGGTPGAVTSARSGAASAGAASALGGVLSGSAAGLTSALAGAGPMGAVAGTLVDQLAGGTLDNTLKGLGESILAVVDNLPSQLTAIAQDVIPGLIGLIPDLVAGIATLIPELVVGLAGSIDDIAIAIVDAIKSIPKAFADAVADLLGLGGAGSSGNPAQDSLARQDPAPGWQTNWGEVAQRSGGRSGGMGRGGGGRVEVHLHGQSAREMFTQLRRDQGSYGLGYSTDPL